ncbi:MAG TPA: SgcJ/EcaC family oxidoreductase [Xanthomonadaceae bacterium]|nr:SgcJ/EcaC family oxidoreductase [Xanthomonadaceae bacterium]
MLGISLRSSPKFRGDDAWNARDADRFAALFTDEAIMSFVDREETMTGRTAIQEVFAQRFHAFPPDLVHQSTVQRVQAVAHGVLAVDSEVIVLRQPAEAGADGIRLRTFRVFALLSRTDTGWRFRDMRIMQMPP